MDMKTQARKALSFLGIDPAKTMERMLKNSLLKASSEQGLDGMAAKLRSLAPDISGQYNTSVIESEYMEIKCRTLHAFQMRMFEKAVGLLDKKRLNVADIGDSAGTHLAYIKGLRPDVAFRTISVNLDQKAVDKIRSKGMEAIRCAAEDLDLGGEPIDLFVTFQMVEHLMNPCLFFRRLAVRGKSDYLLVTVPYRKASAAGFWTYRPLAGALAKNSGNLDDFLKCIPKERFAEDEHIFELSPIDWKMLMLFSGWRPLHDEVYLQYPRRHYLYLTRNLWRRFDFEGFWGVILKRDLSFSNIYKDWRDGGPPPPETDGVPPEGPPPARK